jgi:protein subunit release factor A
MKTSVIVEVRAAEGGEDAKLLVVDQLRTYVRAADLRGL